MKKIHFLLTVVLCAFGGSLNAQSKEQLVQSQLITLQNDTIKVLSSKLDINNISRGFIVIDSTKKRNFRRINPDNYKYLVINDSTFGEIKFKSLKANGMLNGYKNNFKLVIIEHNNSDLEQGKINLYSLGFYAIYPDFDFDSNGEVIKTPLLTGSSTPNISYFIEDKDKHFMVYDHKSNIIPITNRKRMKKYLGKENFKSIRKSDDKELILTQLVNQYNKTIK